MKIAVCHYSLHRTYETEDWSVYDLAAYVKSLDVEGIDFHVRFLGDPDTAADRIGDALGKTGLTLSGLSLSTNFNKPDDEISEEIETAARWLEVAGSVGAPVSRVFGGSLSDRNPDAVLTGRRRVESALRNLILAAEHAGVVLALENHGGLPCTGDEQAKLIDDIGSPWLKATVDIGNYLGCPQDPEEGIQAVGGRCAYVHVKDFIRKDDGTLTGCTVGDGCVDVAGCLRIISDAGYDGYAALEYEGQEDEREGVVRSLASIREAMESDG